MDEREWHEERARLAKVMAELRRQRDALLASREQRAKAIVSDRREMWEEAPHAAAEFDEVVEMAQHVVQLADRERDYRILGDLLRRLERMLHSPYFARIDFRFEGDTAAEPVYIGISSLTAEETGERLIYDWRAPIASMYYDYGIGPAEFAGPAGPVRGELVRKRQYKITDGRIEWMFDSDVGIGDDILQWMLGRNVDEKMSSIVASIQREQNQAIRDDAHDVLVVEGPAGSGKTSIALQRIAYLLYRHRRSLTSQNVMLFAPNRILHDYISNVLPELGEENVQQMTFHEYAVQRLGGGLEVEDMAHHLEYLLAGRRDEAYATRLDGIRMKFSPAYLSLLDAWVTACEQAGMPFANVVYQGSTVVSAAELAQWFYGKLAHLPIHHRMAKLREAVQEKLARLEEQKRRQYERRLQRGQYAGSDEEIRREAEEVVSRHFRRIRLEVRRMFVSLGPRLYEQMYAQAGILAPLAAEAGVAPERAEAVRAQTLAAIRAGRVPFEDVAPLLYLSARLHGTAVNNRILHVLVDEAQDYTRLHAEVLRRMFPRARFTFLGDPRQAIHPLVTADWLNDIGQVFTGTSHTTLHLRRSYRSTQEIVEFARHILPGGREIDPVRRGGEKPRLVRVADEDALVRALADEVAHLQGDGMRAIAVVMRTDAGCAGLYDALAAALPGLRRLTAEDAAFHAGVVLVPVYLAKGLEFDAVLVADASDYQEEAERRLLYTACTRALHRLRLYEWQGAPCPLLAQVPADLYEADVRV
ncbi:DNA helicase [Alicyclobacillus cellulosilyticus]|uniref:DNA helicase n=1 Tax=Alicyclobacillus cellulosilyticus TaxID=1003997 RepID=A0A917NH32_9BACL|nr:RNA polymerase recycling motor HelD [Alicyclobacillus cellulosilyticus]GGJ00626.1 DNA helicase [Alicyclobacillus cellulosilyticus]